MAKITGMKCLVYIKETAFSTATSDLTNTQLLGGQRNATLNRDAETIDATSKDTEGNWMESLPGFKSWSVECEACFISTDQAYLVLEEKFLAGSNVYVAIKGLSGDDKTIWTGEATITSFGLELPYNELVTYGLTLNGSGQLEKKTLA